MEIWTLRGCSVIGPGHIADRLPNQDSILMRAHNGGFISVVSDGMGSRQHSDLGSRAVCKAVYQVIKESSFDIASENLISEIEQRWLQLISQIKPDDAIATCLFAWGESGGDVRMFQLGDGLILGKKGVEKNKDSKHYGNETIGLGCKINASDWKVSEGYIERRESLALMTDGISEDLVPGRELDFLHALSTVVNTRKQRVVKKYLRAQLRNWATPNHVDDKSIIVVIRN
jgi:serine/threonine protein phosphatase PrpC